MSDKMYPMSINNLLNWIFEEFENQKSIFGIPSDKFITPKYSKVILFDEQLSSPLGPAGPGVAGRDLRRVAASAVRPRNPLYTPWLSPAAPDTFCLRADPETGAMARWRTTGWRLCPAGRATAALSAATRIGGGGHLGRRTRYVP